jgi:ubiquinone/menaquinone biosynthesis C-methylase UbiE
VTEAQKRHWSSVADAWAKWLDWTQRNFAPLTTVLRESTRWKPGATVLDVGCGSGYPALAAALAIQPSGRVTAIDVSPRMLAAAAHRAAADRVDNIEFTEMDAESLELDTGTFDVVTCVCTLMFCRDPLRALQEMHRVLSADGRLAVVVWADASLNPFSMIMHDVISRFVALPALPEARSPGPFRFAAEGELDSMLRSAGFADVTTDCLEMPFSFESAEEYLTIVTEVTGWTRRLERLSGDDVSRLRAAVTEAVEPYQVNGGIRLPATVRCGFGRLSARSVRAPE